MISTGVLGDPETFQGEEIVHLAEFSPDERHVAVVVRRGDLASNTVTASLLIFETGTLLTRPSPDTVVTLASSSNRPAISHVRWLADNTTLAFLGERPHGLPQVYTVGILNHAVRQLTAHATLIGTYDITPTGDAVAYTAEPAIDSAKIADRRSRGYVISASAPIGPLLGEDQHDPYKQDTGLFIERTGTGEVTHIGDGGFESCEDLFGIALAPSGDRVLRLCYVPKSPRRWLDYTVDRMVRNSVADQNPRGVLQYVVATASEGKLKPLMDAPWGWSGVPSVAWAPDGRWVVLSNTYLPLDVPDSAERARRESTLALAEVDLATGVATPIAQGDSLGIVRWNPTTSTLTALRGTWRLKGPAVGFQRVHGRWRRVTSRDFHIADATSVVGGAVMLSVEQDLNKPQLLIATSLRTGAKRVMLDPNPQFRDLRLGRVDSIGWRSPDGRVWAGGLYYPPDYVPGKRYPLVIQTHGFRPHDFTLYGSFTTAFAARPLAARGMLVLQAKDPPEEVVNTPREAPTAMENYEAAIAHLDSLGLIDPTRIGIIGFSRTGWYLKYTLTHSARAIAAASVTDATDGGYLQYMTGNRSSQLFKERDLGAMPFGAGLDIWRRESPGFNLDKVRTPLRIQAINSWDVLGEWEWYAGLRRLGRPVEMSYLPDGLHELVKPWERLSSEQGNVDWFAFWLKGEEDPDPAKAEQYARWRQLRKLQQEERVRDHPPAGSSSSP